MGNDYVEEEQELDNEEQDIPEIDEDRPQRAVVVTKFAIQIVGYSVADIRKLQKPVKELLSELQTIDEKPNSRVGF